MFGQRDPLFSFGTGTLYGYADGELLGLIDPSGMFCFASGCTGTGPLQKCKSCWGTSCRGDRKCPPREPKKPKPGPNPPDWRAPNPGKPFNPTPGISGPALDPGNPLPIPIDKAPDCCVAMGSIWIRKQIYQLEMDYNEGKISDDEYMRRKADLEKALKACNKYQEK